MGPVSVGCFSLLGHLLNKSCFSSLSQSPAILDVRDGLLPTFFGSLPTRAGVSVKQTPSRIKDKVYELPDFISQCVFCSIVAMCSFEEGGGRDVTLSCFSSQGRSRRLLVS